MESTLREYNNPRESNCRIYWPLRYVTLRYRYVTVRGYDSACQCKCASVSVSSDFIGAIQIVLLLLLLLLNNRRFTEFFDRYFHIPLPIATKHELGLSFPPRNLRIKFGANSSTIFLVIVVTDRQTDRQTHTHTNQRRWIHIPSLSRG